MGRRGPAPEPTNLKMLRGARPARINFDEPRPRDLPPERPAWLSDGAAAEWDRVAADLAVMGTVKAADSTCLAVYCEAVARWRRLAALAAAQDPVAVRDDGARVRNPVFSQARDAAAEVRVWAREFGLTPSARAGIRVELYPRLPGGRLLS